MSHNMSGGQKWTQFEKEYMPSDCTSDTKILMTDGAGDDLSVCNEIFKIQNFD